MAPRNIPERLVWVVDGTITALAALELDHQRFDTVFAVNVNLF